MIIPLTQEEYEMCLKFSDNVVETNKDCYASRNQTNVTKIKDDILVGKLAEYAVYKLLLLRGKNVTAPDLQVYSTNRKSFSADLKDEVFEYHVKCMKSSAAARFGLSWSFQKQDKLVTQPKTNDIIVLSEYTDAGDIEVKALVRAQNMQKLYTKPVLRKLQDIKCVLMWDDVYEYLRTK
jgi:hypothetical protein